MKFQCGGSAVRGHTRRCARPRPSRPSSTPRATRPAYTVGESRQRLELSTTVGARPPTPPLGASVDHVASLLLGTRQRWGVRGAGRRDRHHLPELGGGQLRDGGDRALRRLHLRRAPAGRAAAHLPGPPRQRRPRGRRWRSDRRRRSPWSFAAAARRRCSTWWCSGRCATRRSSPRPWPRSACSSSCRACSPCGWAPRRSASPRSSSPSAGSSGASPSSRTGCTSPSPIVGLTLALAAVYRFTRFGLVTQAVAESQTGAYVSGISPGPGRAARTGW